MTEADRRFRKNLVAACLVMAPLLITIGQIVAGGIDEDEQAAYLARIAANETEFYVGNLISIAGAFLIPLAVLGLVHLVRVRRRILGTVVGVVVLVGAFGLPGAWLAGSLIEYVAAQQPDRAAMAGLLRDLESDAAIPIFVVWISFTLGLLLTAVGLFVARTVPRWMAGLLAVSVVALFVSDAGVTGIIAGLVIVAAWGAIGWSIHRRTPDQWAAGELPSARGPVTTEPPASPAVAMP
jgi:hypothetical protein